MNEARVGGKTLRVPYKTLKPKETFRPARLYSVIWRRSYPQSKTRGDKAVETHAHRNSACQVAASVKWSGGGRLESPPRSTRRRRHPPPRRAVVYEGKISWPARGPNVDWTIGSTMRRRRRSKTSVAKADDGARTQNGHVRNDTRDASRRIVGASFSAICRRNCVEDGKEGVDGSSPSEGFAVLAAQPSFLLPTLAAGDRFGVHPASTAWTSGCVPACASSSLIACSRPSRARWP